MSHKTLRPLSILRIQRKYAIGTSNFACKRCLSSVNAATTDAVIDPPNTTTQSAKNSRPLTQKERDFLESCIRVNQAGELGANLIYAGQYAVLKHDKRLKPLIRHMWDQEVHHLNTFNSLVAKHRIRPTALRPIWNVAGYALGLGTALMGEKAAMACTEAVETEIGTHYNNQLRVLLEMLREGDVQLDKDSELGQLVKTIPDFRGDQLEHLDTAVEHDAKGAQGYELLTGVIRGGCKAAIWLSKRY